MALMGRNLTVHLDDETITKAKVLAARKSTSVSKLVASEIRRLVDQDDTYRIAEAAALSHLDHGFPLGAQPLPDRESLHDR